PRSDDRSSQFGNTGIGVAERVKDTAASLGDKAKDAAHTVAEKAKDVGSSVVANSLESTGRYLQEEGLKGIADDMTNMIRRNPIPALLVGVGVGFLIA